MKKRTILTTLLAFVLLAAVVAAGMNAVFTVSYVNAQFHTCTREGEEAARQLKEELNAYLGKSTTFLDLEEVRVTAQSNPRFDVVTVEKQYPAAVYVEIVERRSAFAYANAAGGYDVFDVDGNRIGESATAEGFIELAGDFSLTCENGKLTGNYAEELLSAYAVMAELLGEPRANILSVSLEDNSATGTTILDRFRIATREGVEITMREPSVRVDEKVRAGVETYLGLPQEDRVRGQIIVVIRKDTDRATAEYTSAATSD